MRIVSTTPSVDKETFFRNVAMRSGVHRRFVEEMMPVAWDTAYQHVLDPPPFIVQSGHETGWGNFTRAVRPTQFNPAGIKVYDPLLDPEKTNVDTETLAHYSFTSWGHGYKVHALAILLHAGQFDLIDAMQNFEMNPRRRFVEPRVRAGRVLEQWEQFGVDGAWLDSPEYGKNIVRVTREIRGF